MLEDNALSLPRPTSPLEWGNSGTLKYKIKLSNNNDEEQNFAFRNMQLGQCGAMEINPVNYKWPIYTTQS